MNVTCFDRPLIPPLVRFLTRSHPGLANTELQNLPFVSLGHRFSPQYLSLLRLIHYPILYPLCDVWLSSFICVSERDRHLFYLLACSNFSLGEFSQRHLSTVYLRPVTPPSFRACLSLTLPSPRSGPHHPRYQNPRWRR